MRARCRALDWGSTPLGPSAGWTASLRATAQSALGHVFPQTVLWGPELAQIYNDGYSALMGEQRSLGLGQPTPVYGPEAWPNHAPVYDRVRRGESIRLEASALFPGSDVSGGEDARYTLGYSPLYDDGCRVAGMLLTVFDSSAPKPNKEASIGSVDRRRVESALQASEARYRALATASADVIYRINLDWSDMRQLDGRGFLSDTPASSQPEPIDVWLGRYIHADDQTRVKAAIDLAVRTHDPFELEHRVIRADGTLGWTLSRAVGVFDESGTIIEWIGAASDVTERKEASLALHASEARHRALFDSLDEGACVFERLAPRPDGRRDYRYLAINPAMQAMFGIRDLSGASIRDAFPDEVEAWYDDYDRVLETGRPARFERESQPQGVVLDMFVTRLEDGSGRRLLAVMRDVTARKRAEEMRIASEARQAFLLRFSDALRPMARPAEIQAEAMRLLEDYLGGAIAHFWQADPADPNGVSTDENASGRPRLLGPMRVGDYGARILETLSAGNAVSMADAKADPRISAAEFAHYEAVGVRAYIGAPLVEHGRLVGLLSVHQPLPRAWRADEVALVGEVAERTWAAVERARAEAALRESEARYRALVDNVRDYAIFGLDRHGRVTEWTTGAQRVKGYTAEEVVGQHLAFFFTPEDVAAGHVEAELTEAARTGRAEREGWRVRKGGERFWVNEIATAVRADGELRGFTKISRDLTSQKRTEDERASALARERTARHEAESAMVLREQFLTVVSHELRTPLMSILLWSKLLRAGAVPPAQHETALASIETSASVQKQLIEDLLDVSSMLSGKVKLNLHELELGPVLDAAVAAVMPMAEYKGIRIDTDFQAKPCRARVDPDRLQQVIWNLINNAVKFTSTAGSVKVRLSNEGAFISISVEDTGQGISPEFLPHVFERFRQQDASITRSQGGLGLGLAIARQLVELQGGTIAAASAGEGQGATFTVTLPSCVRPAAPPEEANSSPPPYALSGVRLLLVEDDFETQQALVWLLEASGAKVTATASAVSALAALAESWPDVVVSDIGLPGEDGYELMKRICAHAAVQKRPVPPALALTAYARDEDRERAHAAGFAAYAAKPIEPQALLDAVAALVRTANAGRARMS